MSIRQRPRFVHAQSLAALLTLVFLAACGSCNCNVPGYHAPPPGATPLPPGVTPSPMPSGTPAAVACSQGSGSVPLGSALAPFAVLAGATVTNVGNTLVTYGPGAVTAGVNDDLVGVSPGTAVTGFYTPGTDTDGQNAIYAAGYNANTAVPLAAQTALTTAYTTLAGEPAGVTFLGGQDLSQASVAGHAVGTLPPGVYKSASSLSIMAGNLTLDGGGNAQGVFIFQMGSTLTTTLNGGAGGNVILTGGASACNIYWQGGSSAVLGGATFYGDVLANQSITVNATTFNGRALASVGSVTIPVAGGSTITNPGGQ